ncbi:hypothetical protein HDU96_005167 [Phlyctochytrium bullatum]|nr:hypothetical protein HDU96_005167 [Phlyctochytrium bullatum]
MPPKRKRTSKKAPTPVDAEDQDEQQKPQNDTHADEKPSDAADGDIEASEEPSVKSVAAAESGSGEERENEKNGESAAEDDKDGAEGEGGYNGMNGSAYAEDSDEEDEELGALSKVAKKSSRLADRFSKLKELSRLRSMSKEDNRKEVYTEFQSVKRNPKDDIRAERKKREAEILAKRQEAEETGTDYERSRFMNYSVQDVERYEKKLKQKSKRADTGFTDYTQAAARKYLKQVSSIKPNMAHYEEQKKEAQALGVQVGGSVSAYTGDGFYRDANSLAYAAQKQPTAKSVDKLVGLVKKDIETRKTFSRRRRHNEDDDVTHINERNMRFNKKIARAYDRHTAEIRAAFERGTAL